MSKSVNQLKRGVLMNEVRLAMVDTCVGIFASTYYKAANKPRDQQRTQVITEEFQQLLVENFRLLKKITDYAALLAISPAYLNEAVKKTTGPTAGRWLQQAVISEAKRLLFNTELSIKEIAYDLGFTDHAYFSTYFLKAEKISPMSFRNKYRQI